MSKSEMNPLWKLFIRTVQEEVKPALGCTEPISLALVSAVAASRLSGPIERIDAWVSPNLMKNGMGVTVPGTGMVGLPIAAALGAVGGDAHADLEVLKAASQEDIASAKMMLEEGRVHVMLQSPCEDILYSRVKAFSGNEWASVTIVGGHTRIVRIETQDGVCFTLDEGSQDKSADDPLTILSHSSLVEILTFINQVSFEDIRFILEAARLNDALSQEGLRGRWGLHIGATLEKQCERGLMAKDLLSEILIRTSAASDARMGGAMLPAMSNSGSGNQGIAATLPVVVVAEHL